MDVPKHQNNHIANAKLTQPNANSEVYRARVERHYGTFQIKINNVGSFSQNEAVQCLFPLAILRQALHLLQLQQVLARQKRTGRDTAAIFLYLTVLEFDYLALEIFWWP